MWIRVQGKARGGEKAQHTRQYVSILSRPATPPWGLRRMFEMGSSLLDGTTRPVRYKGKLLTIRRQCGGNVNARMSYQLPHNLSVSTQQMDERVVVGETRR